MIAPRVLLFYAVLSFSGRSATFGCYIQGSDTGVCDRRLMEESEYRAVEMPFCGSVVDYPACVPEQKPIPPDRKFHRDGRWVNHTTPTKDEVYALFGLELHLITFFVFQQWVRTTVKEMIKYRLGLEVNKTLLNKGKFRPFSQKPHRVTLSSIFRGGRVRNQGRN